MYDNVTDLYILPLRLRGGRHGVTFRPPSSAIRHLTIPVGCNDAQPCDCRPNHFRENSPDRQDRGTIFRAHKPTLSYMPEYATINTLLHEGNQLLLLGNQIVQLPGFDIEELGNSTLLIQIGQVNWK
ncbi:hypothetical protein [Streptomyces acidiscabies]|uniref:hypothetical protein n=1 Tax=Streptomyces acidiscabies TaxID=42234 RepID=UPI00131A9A40|nr:hypothetical protein [Streptomyces acidiscabies]